MKTPRWRSELAAEIAMHQQLGIKAQHLAPQVAGLGQDLEHYLTNEPRMLDYAGQILREAAEAAPTGRQPQPGYQPTRWLLDRQWLVADPGAVDALTERWQALPVPAVTAVVWVVRRLISIHARRHGAVASPHVDGFLSGHGAAVAVMERTLHGNRPPERRYVQAWRRRS
jgi:hypothetical protein